MGDGKEDYRMAGTLGVALVMQCSDHAAGISGGDQKVEFTLLCDLESHRQSALAKPA